MNSIRMQRPAQPEKEQNVFQRLVNSPAFPPLLNVGYFIAGVVFISSPLMDAMAPQL